MSSATLSFNKEFVIKNWIVSPSKQFDGLRNNFSPINSEDITTGPIRDSDKPSSRSVQQLLADLATEVTHLWLEAATPESTGLKFDIEVPRHYPYPKDVYYEPINIEWNESDIRVDKALEEFYEFFDANS